MGYGRDASSIPNTWVDPSWVRDQVKSAWTGLGLPTSQGNPEPLQDWEVDAQNTPDWDKQKISLGFQSPYSQEFSDHIRDQMRDGISDSMASAGLPEGGAMVGLSTRAARELDNPNIASSALNDIWKYIKPRNLTGEAQDLTADQIKNSMHWQDRMFQARMLPKGPEDLKLGNGVEMQAYDNWLANPNLGYQPDEMGPSQIMKRSRLPADPNTTFSKNFTAHADEFARADRGISELASSAVGVAPKTEALLTNDRLYLFQPKMETISGREEDLMPHDPRIQKFLSDAENAKFPAWEKMREKFGTVDLDDHTANWGRNPETGEMKLIDTGGADLHKMPYSVETSIRSNLKALPGSTKTIEALLRRLPRTGAGL